MKKKRIVRLLTMLCVLTLLAAFMAIPASAAASNVSGAIEGTWNAAKGQVQTIVNNVVFFLLAFSYCTIKVFFANIKRGGILLIQIAVG